MPECIFFVKNKHNVETMSDRKDSWIREIHAIAMLSILSLFYISDGSSNRNYGEMALRQVVGNKKFL